MEALFLAFGMVLLAELGDKSQLAALTFSTRFPARWVLAGLLTASVVTQALSVMIGATLGATLPTTAVGLAAAAVFLAFAWWTWRRPLDGGAADAQRSVSARTGIGIATTVATTITVAEFGDKTMLATVALAARTDPLQVLLGGVAGMTAAGVLAVVAGRELGKRVPEPVLRGLAAAGFLAAGLWMLVIAWRG